MAKYANENEINQRVTDLRTGHSAMRCEIALRQSLGIAYANGRHWISVQTASSGESMVDVWNEEWDPHQQEVRMTDNKIGPLYRNIAARNNAVRIEAAVSPRRHVRSIQCSRRAAISQDTINALHDDLMLTLAARQASSLRWQAGSSLLVLQASRKRSKISPDILTHPDGSPLEYNDQWLRWEVCPLTDLIWDASNLCPDLQRHETLILEQTMSAKKFEQIYGPLTSYGIDRDSLPMMSEVAPHYIAASAITGTSIFTAYARQSKERAVRVLLLLESDPNDPGRWPECYTIIDANKSSPWNTDFKGMVINKDNPSTPFGGHGRNIFKLDGFRRSDSVWAFGVPHVVMGQQDMLNIAKSIQFQQLTAVVYGHWVIDSRSTSEEEFTSRLAEGIGGVLAFDSHGDPQVHPPQYVAPPAPNQEFTLITSELALGMRDQVHISAANLGIGKTHVPQSTQQMLLQEAGVVLDNIMLADADEYSDALRVTLGTIRNVVDQPGRMLARLRDHHGLTASDLAEFFNMTPQVNEFEVRVRESSVLRRSADERKGELDQALQTQSISPQEHRIAMAEDLERPLMRIDEIQLDFIKERVSRTILGQPWIGISSIDYGLFDYVVKKAVYGLDFDDPADVAAMARLEEARVIQQAIAAENTVGTPNGGPPGAVASAPNDEALLPDMRGGAPESINPMSNPLAAAGGLSLGLTG